LKTITNAFDLAQLKAEVIAISEIHSKNVVEVYDLLFDSKGELEGIIEEYVSGSDLTGFASVPYNQARYLKVLFQIASGIADIHGHGIVHRDIKLNNLKQDTEGIIKLFDFGLASEDSAHTTVAARATMIYAAPELYSTPLIVERSLDTYAFGVCCWTLRTAKLPAALMETPPQMSGRPPSLSTIDSTLPSDLVACLDSTLEPIPANRPSMSEVRDNIGRHLLFGQHRAWLTGGHHISVAGQSVSIGYPNLGKIAIRYDGIRFYVSALDGEVYINNDILKVGDELPRSCVITLGAPHRGSSRQFVQFNVSHPEIVL